MQFSILQELHVRVSSSEQPARHFHFGPFAGLPEADRAKFLYLKRQVCIPDHQPGGRLQGIGKVVQRALIIDTQGHRAVAQLPALVHLEHLVWQHPQREPVLHLQANL